MSYLERWSARAREQLEERKFKKEQVREAKRLIAEQALSWDGESWTVYPVEFHVKKQGEGFVCDCDLFRKEGFCSHAYAVLLKERGET